MSYIRASWPYIYVDGESDSYVFLTGRKKGHRIIECIEDYGSVSNEALVEMFATNFHHDEEPFRKYMIEKFAERLGVKLRKKRLTDSQYMIMMDKKMKKDLKNNPFMSEFVKGVQGDKHGNKRCSTGSRFV
jgi:hypothetical protein